MRDSHPPMPHHSRNSSAITSISISVHIKSTHSLSIPAIFRFHFTSFGNTTYCIYPPSITALSSSPSIPRNPNQAIPPGTPTFPNFGFRHEAISSRIGQFSLYNRPRLAYTGNMPDCRHSIQTNLTASDKLGHTVFFCLPLWDGRGKGKSPASPSSKIMNCGVEHVHCLPPTRVIWSL